MASEKAVAAAYLKWLVKKGPIRTLVVANPADDNEGLGGMAALAPWIALQKHAALLLTNVAGGNVEDIVHDCGLAGPDAHPAAARPAAKSTLAA